MEKVNIRQMLLSLVNVCRRCSMAKSDKTIRIPPLIEGSQTLRYDSIFNSKWRHYIVYDLAKAYPSYLITYINDITTETQ